MTYILNEISTFIRNYGASRPLSDRLEGFCSADFAPSSRGGNPEKSKVACVSLHRGSAHGVVLTLVVFDLLEVCPENRMKRINECFLRRNVISSTEKKGNVI